MLVFIFLDSEEHQEVVLPTVSHDDILSVENPHHQHAVLEVLWERIQVEVYVYSKCATTLGA